MQPIARIHTRQATTADTDFARSAHHAAYRAVVEHQFGSWDEAAQDAFFAADWRPSEMEILLVDDAPCGYWAVEDRSVELHLREVVIHPDQQGRGIGTAMLRRLQHCAAERNIPIMLGTLHQNRAFALYLRLGFHQIGATDTHVLMAWHPMAERMNTFEIATKTPNER